MNSSKLPKWLTVPLVLTALLTLLLLGTFAKSVDVTRSKIDGVNVSVGEVKEKASEQRKQLDDVEKRLLATNEKLVLANQTLDDLTNGRAQKAMDWVKAVEAGSARFPNAQVILHRMIASPFKVRTSWDDASVVSTGTMRVIDGDLHLKIRLEIAAQVTKTNPLTIEVPTEIVPTESVQKKNFAVGSGVVRFGEGHTYPLVVTLGDQGGNDCLYICYQQVPPDLTVHHANAIQLAPFEPSDIDGLRMPQLYPIHITLDVIFPVAERAMVGTAN